MKSSSLAPVSCITTTVDSKYRHSYHVFGQQEGSFDGVMLEGDEILVVRMYMVNDDDVKYKVQASGRGSAGGFGGDSSGSLYQMSLSLEESDETSGEILVAWGVLSLVASQKKGELNLIAGTLLLFQAKGFLCCLTLIHLSCFSGGT